MSSTVFNLLERIQKSPGMYLGYPSVQSLFMFINGYEVARDEVGIELTEEEEFFYGEFQPWLQRKLGVRSVTSWAKLIMLSCHDEKTGFERFFQLLSEFRKEKSSSQDDSIGGRNYKDYTYPRYSQPGQASTLASEAILQPE